MRLQGDYNAAKTRSIVIEFQKCEKKAYCKSDTEIKDWLKRKFILTYTNRKRFQIEEFNNQKIIDEAKTTWIPINSQLREDVVFQLQVTNLQLQDRIWQWGSLTTEYQNDLFKIDQIGIRPYEFPNSVHMSITYEFDLNLEVIDR